MHGGLYCLHDSVNIHEEKYLMNCNVLNSKGYDIDIWHFRLGHPSKHVVEQVCKIFPYANSNFDKLCDICHLAKQHKLHFQISDLVSLNTFDLIHIDILGPITISFVHGHKYFLTTIDDFSRHSWIFLIKTKGETRNLLHNFIILVKNQFNQNNKTIRTDNGKEFDCNELYEKYGILHQRTCVETFQQNIVAERKH